MSVESIAQKWHDQLLRADPIDHPSAEAAIRAAYRAAELAEPQHFLWCASPLAAAWAVLVLIGTTDPFNHAVYEDVGRSKSGQEKIAHYSTSVAEQLGIGEGEVDGYFGKPFYRMEGSSPLASKLTEQSIDAWMAKADAGDDFLAIHARGPFKRLHDLEHALLYEGYRNRDGGLRPSLIRDAMLTAGGKHLEILGGRSAHHRLYGSMAYSEIAVEEALAELGKFQPTELQRAMWEAYEACGMWWPCDGGVVLAERPTAANKEHNGVRLTWPDGFTFTC